MGRRAALTALLAAVAGASLAAAAASDARGLALARRVSDAYTRVAAVELRTAVPAPGGGRTVITQRLVAPRGVLELVVTSADVPRGARSRTGTPLRDAVTVTDYRAGISLTRAAGARCWTRLPPPPTGGATRLFDPALRRFARPRAAGPLWILRETGVDGVVGDWRIERRGLRVVSRTVVSAPRGSASRPGEVTTWRALEALPVLPVIRSVC